VAAEGTGKTETERLTKWIKIEEYQIIIYENNFVGYLFQLGKPIRRIWQPCENVDSHFEDQTDFLCNAAFTMLLYIYSENLHLKDAYTLKNGL